MQIQASQHHYQPSKEHHEKANLAIRALRKETFQTLKASDSFEAAEKIKQILAEAEEKRQENQR